MKRRLFLIFVVAALCGPPLVHAFMPVAIENVIRSWFNGAGKLVRFTFSESTAPTLSTSGKCVLYMDATANALMASCNGGTFKMVIGSGGAANCAEDTEGVLTCTGYISANQNVRTIPEANRIVLQDDEGTPATPLCSTDGVSGTMTLMDIDSSSIDTYVACNNTTETWAFPTTQPPALLTPYNTPVIAGGADTAALTANQVRCMRYVAPWSRTITKYSTWTRTVGAASQTVAVCIYNDSDAATQLISDMGRVTVTDDEDVDTSSAVTAFTLHAGTTYRVCWTSADTSVLLLGAPVNGIVTDAANPVLIGNAATASTGTTGTLACATSTGALTGVTTAGAQIELF